LRLLRPNVGCSGVWTYSEIDHEILHWRAVAPRADFDRASHCLPRLRVQKRGEPRHDAVVSSAECPESLYQIRAVQSLQE